MLAYRQDHGETQSKAASGSSINVASDTCLAMAPSFGCSPQDSKGDQGIPEDVLSDCAVLVCCLSHAVQEKQQAISTWSLMMLQVSGTIWL